MKSYWQKSTNPFIKHVIFPLAGRLEKTFAAKNDVDSSCYSREKAFLDRITCRSPFSVALGRFTCLKLPITISMGIARKLLVLLLGVGLFSLAWDTLYILIGVFGASSKISQTSMLIYTLGGFISIQIILFCIRRLKRSRRLAYTR
jgi:hypothetical protein